MSESEKNKELLKQAKFLLDHSADSIDDQTKVRLASMRHRAIESGKPGSFWFKPAMGLGAACALFLVFYFSANRTSHQEIGVDLADIELLSAEESIEFYDELEFYGWLAEKEAEGAG